MSEFNAYCRNLRNLNYSDAFIKGFIKLFGADLKRLKRLTNNVGCPDKPM